MAINNNDNTTPDKVISSTSVNQNPSTFLYDVGLQNVFQDYQKGMQQLNTQQEQSLQDAYYIREMSKKYLGEYASNVGMGDVSGNLLDIYGQYQQNVAQTRSEFAQQQSTLQGAYDSAVSQLESGKMAAELSPTASNEGVGVYSVTDRFLPDGSTNPNYVENFDILDYYGSDPDVTENSRLYFVGNLEYVSVGVPAGEESEGSAFTASTDDINEWYADEFSNPESAYYQKPLSTGSIVFFPENQAYYVRQEDGKFYRLKSGNAFTESRGVSEQSNMLYVPTGETSTTVNVGGIQFNIETPNYTGMNALNLGAVKVTRGETEYTLPVTTEDGVVQFEQGTFFLANNTQSLTPDQKQILDLFHKNHNTSRTQRGRDQKNISDIRKNSFVFYNGKMYMFVNGTIVTMKRK